MGTWNAFYVKSEDEAAIVAIRREFPEAETDANGEYIGVKLADDAFEAPERKLSDLSQRFNTDVIWMSFQSVVDAFQFHHWRAGARLRSLVFGCFEEERTWERVEGTPEPWEREVFFDEKDLKIPLECATTEQDKAKLRRIWQDAELLPGRTEPSLDSRGCAHKIARHYQLPHYGL
jgi:hypothetical protein